MSILISISAAEKSASLPADWSTWGSCFCLPVLPSALPAPSIWLVLLSWLIEGDTSQERACSASKYIWETNTAPCPSCYSMVTYPLRETGEENTFSMFCENSSSIRWESLGKIYWQELKQESASVCPFLPPAPTHGWLFLGGHTSQQGVLVCFSQGYDLGEPENRSGGYEKGWFSHNSHKPSKETLHIYSICWSGGESREKFRQASTAALFFSFLLENSLANPKQQKHQKEGIS